MDERVLEAGKPSIVRTSAPSAISLHERPQSQRLRVVDLLTVLAEARQAPVSPQTYELFSSELSRYDLADVEAAVRKLMKQRREDGQTAFPDLPTLEDAIREAKNVRLRTEREQRERAQAEAEERDRWEHPENYVDAGPNLANFFSEFFARRGQQQEQTSKESPLPKKGVCPHCNGVQLSAFTAADLRALADVVEKRDALKVRERTA